MYPITTGGTMTNTFTYQLLDEATIALVWQVRLAATMGRDLHDAIDALHGIESVEVFRYGARIDLAPHVVDLDALPGQLQAALELVVVPVWGPIEFEVNGFGFEGDPDCAD